MVISRNFLDLDVYNRSFELAVDIHAASLNFPKIEQYALADQMRRASKGICANIAEGFGKQAYSQIEFRRFLAMAIGSANEMNVWVQFCQRLEYISPEKAISWSDEYTSIAKMLNALMRRIADEQKTKTS